MIRRLFLCRVRIDHAFLTEKLETAAFCDRIATLTPPSSAYLKKFDHTNPTTRDPHEAERRLLMDTYRTFGCEDSQPTFRYSLIDGVKDGFLINPTVVDARTDVTTQLLSEEGFIVETVDENGDSSEESYEQRQFEKKFFSPETNQLFCKTFLENALRDPVSKEIGKSIVFAVIMPTVTQTRALLVL